MIHEQVHCTFNFPKASKKERPLGTNAIKHKVNLPLICEYIVAHLTMNTTWPSNLRLPKSKTYMGIKQL